MFRIASWLRFYRGNTNKPFSNPLRRWVPFYFIGGIFSVGVGYEVFQFVQLNYEVQKYGDNSGNYLCGPTMLDFLSLLPFNLLSSGAGTLASQEWIPSWVHQQLISWITRYYDINLDEATPNTFSTFQEFYGRSWKQDARPIAPADSLISPCDGEVLSVMEGVEGDRVVQVKGCSYSMRSLFRTLPLDSPQENMKRVMIVIKLRLNDFHHVISPCNFLCKSSVYIPGTLLPISQTWYHYIPGLLTMNERVVICGTSSHTPILLALVGSTLTGKIKIAFDNRIRTNFLDPQEYAVGTKYESPLTLLKGAPVGHFLWGSAVVLLMDIPESSTLRVRCGSRVKAGESLLS